MPFSYRAKVQRQPICPARSSPADGEKNLHRRIFFFKSVLPSSISVRSYSSLPTLQGRTAVESIGTTRIRHTQALWTQAIKQIFYLSTARTIYQSLCCSIENAYIRSNGLSFGQSISRTIERSIYRIIECSRVSCFHIR